MIYAPPPTRAREIWTPPRPAILIPRRRFAPPPLRRPPIDPRRSRLRRFIDPRRPRLRNVDLWWCGGGVAWANGKALVTTADCLCDEPPGPCDDCDMTAVIADLSGFSPCDCVQWPWEEEQVGLTGEAYGTTGSINGTYELTGGCVTGAEPDVNGYSGTFEGGITVTTYEGEIQPDRTVACDPANALPDTGGGFSISVRLDYPTVGNARCVISGGGPPENVHYFWGDAAWDGNCCTLAFGLTFTNILDGCAMVPMPDLPSVDLKVLTSGGSVTIVCKPAAPPGP